LNPCDVTPVAIVPSEPYDEMAAKDGTRVEAKVPKKAANEQKTTAGNVLPRTHSRIPPSSWRIQPEK
jgi:hypothetical protein